MFEKLTLKELKTIVKDYNLKNSIKGFSTLKKSALIKKIKEHMKYENNVLKRLNNNYKFNLKDLGERKKRGPKKQTIKTFKGVNDVLPNGSRTSSYNRFREAWLNAGIDFVADVSVKKKNPRP